MPDLIYEKHDRHAVFTMNRPERLNALGGSMGAELDEALADFAADRKMRAGIVTGSGRAFSAGMDLKQRDESNRRLETGDAERPASVRGGITGGPFSRSPKPIIAAINGLAIAGGFERALDCDIRISSTEAYFALFEVRRGILAGYAVHHLARNIPFGEAMYILLTADRISPDEARRVGLIHEIVEPDQLMPRATEIAEMIAENAPLAIEGTKAIAHHWRQLQLAESSELARWVNRVVAESDDAREGVRAFVEKRAPDWTGT